MIAGAKFGERQRALRAEVGIGMFLKVLFDILWARRIIVLVAAGSCMVGGALVAATFPERYQATALVVLDYIKPDPITGAYINSKMAESYTKTQIELIRAGQTGVLAAEALGLLDSAELQNRFAASGGNPADFASWVGHLLMDATGVQALPDSNMIEISSAASTREAALANVDAIRTAYLRTLVQNRQSGAAASANNLALQAEKVSAELADLEAARRALQDRGGDSAGYDAQKLQDLISTVRGRYIEKEGSVLSANRLAMLEAELAQASRELGPNHPKIAELKSARDALKAQVAQEIQAASAVGASAGVAEHARQTELERLKGRVLSNRLTALEMRLLQEEIASRTVVLQSHNAKIAELRTLGAVQSAGATALGEPIAKSHAVFPNPVLILIGTGLVGGASGVLLAVLIELLDRRLRSGAELARAVGAPLWGEVPGASALRAKRKFRPVRLVPTGGTSKIAA